MNWIVEYYVDAKGHEPVAEFLDSLTIGSQARALRLMDLLANYGVLLKEPYSRRLKGKLRELRITDRFGEIRIVYCPFTGRRLILLHGFIKKTRKTPSRDIEIAERRLSEFIHRQGV
jgi:phage-related protein